MKVHAVRLGSAPRLMEFVQSIRSTQDQWFYLFTACLTLGYLWIRRDAETASSGWSSRRWPCRASSVR